MRLDQLLVQIGLARSRSRARDAIVRGCVEVDDCVVRRPGQDVDVNAKIAIDDPASPFVSRAALKLIAGLNISGINVRGKACLDIGASTGGFTQVLLRYGARHVVALDVGHGQMSPQITGDARVDNRQGLNARYLARTDLAGHRIEIIVCDVSFISLKLALPPALDLAEPGAAGVFLVKPQFEAGREHIGKGGVVRNMALAKTVAEDLKNWIDRYDGWQQTHLLPSPLIGQDGNQEFLLCARKSDNGKTG